MVEMGPTNGDSACGRGAQDGDRELQSHGNTEDLEGQREAGGSGDRGGGGVPEDYGLAGVTENQGGAVRRSPTEQEDGVRRRS